MVEMTGRELVSLLLDGRKAMLLDGVPRDGIGVRISYRHQAAIIHTQGGCSPGGILGAMREADMRGVIAWSVDEIEDVLRAIPEEAPERIFGMHITYDDSQETPAIAAVQEIEKKERGG